MDVALTPDPVELQAMSLTAIPFLKKHVIDALKAEYDALITQRDALKTDLEVLQTRFPQFETWPHTVNSNRAHTAQEESNQAHRYLELVTKFDAEIGQVVRGGRDKEEVLRVWRQGSRYIVQAKREIFELSEDVGQYQRAFRYV